MQTPEEALYYLERYCRHFRRFGFEGDDFYTEPDDRGKALPADVLVAMFCEAAEAYKAHYGPVGIQLLKRELADALWFPDWAWAFFATLE